MDSQRNLLIIALLFVSFMIWQAWEQDKNPQPQQQTTQTTTTAAGSAADQGVPASGQGKQITVKTDVLELTINTRGGDVEQALLLTYPKELKATDHYWHVTSDVGLNMRVGPGTNYNKWQLVPAHTCLQDLGHNEDNTWILSKYAGWYGWVSMEYLEEVTQ